MKTVVITGASTGIGRAATERLSIMGWRVFAGVRSDKDAEELSRLKGDVRPIKLDVTDAGQIAAAVETVSEALKGTRLAGIVNNAGVAMMGPLAEQSMEDFKAHFAVNVFGALETTRAFIPLLGSDPDRVGAPGRIINITSVGGRVAAPFLGAYTATKHAMESVTDSLRRELVVYGIDSIAIGPGSVRTPIWDKAEEKNEGGPYSDTAWAHSIQTFADTMLKGGRDGFPPEKIAEVIETALSDDKPKARYAPVPDKLTNWILPNLLPKRIVDRVFWKKFEIKKPG